MIGINLVGGRVHSQSEWNTRMQNDADWVDDQFQTKGSQVRAAVVYCQAGPNNSNRDLFYNQFRQSAAAFGKPVLLLHGDGHFWIYDQPFPEQNIYRIQVNMGGNEDPVQLTVNLNPVNPFVYLRNPWSNNPPLYNVMPCVEAGPDTTISLPDVVELHARTRDDGVPLNPGMITRTWSKVSGPGTVNFANPNADTTTASFSTAGVYTLRMTANDGALQNYDDLVVTAIAPGPMLTINDVIHTEGNSGTSNATFTVSLLNGNGSTVTVNFATADSNATAGVDYTASSGTLIFSGLTTTRTINVTVNGDTQIEPDETFFVNLFNAANATILDPQGRGVIENDDSLPPGAGPVVHEETKSGGSSGSLTVSTATALSGVTGNLYLAAISTRSVIPVSSVSGLGLTWTLVDAQCAGRSQTDIEVWMAQGVPAASGIVTATFATAPVNAVITVSRYSGVATTSPVGAIVSGNTNGINGSCSGGIDSDAFSFNITASLSGAAIYAAVAPRSRILTPNNPYILRNATYQGTGGGRVGVAIQDRNVEPAATVPVGGSFNGTTDWSVIAVEIKPGGGIPNLAVNVKTFLQGPYQGGGMNTALRDNGKLPLAQPYNASPWNYNGSEAVDAIPAGVVDWVLVGLRSTATGTDLARRAAFIKSDGSVVEISGSGGVEFAGVAPGDYFVVIYHRNHLGIMSKNALPLSDNSALYNFSTALTQAYGSNPMAEMETGVFGMISGDGNSDGTVNNADRLLWRSQNGTPWLYGKGGDFNLDGGVDASDLNYAWRANNGAMTGVPGVALSAGITGSTAAPAGK